VNKKYLAWTAVIIYSALIFIGSSIPGDQINVDGPGIDKLLHSIEYLILSLLVSISLRFSDTFGRRTAFWITIIGSSLYGISDEVHQIFVPLREFDILDIACDTSGSIIGAYIMFRTLNNDSRYPFKP
jgi:VanZ family protein